MSEYPENRVALRLPPDLVPASPVRLRSSRRHQIQLEFPDRSGWRSFRYRESNSRPVSGLPLRMETQLTLAKRLFSPTLCPCSLLCSVSQTGYRFSPPFWYCRELKMRVCRTCELFPRTVSVPLKQLPALCLPVGSRFF
ncbi:hypothetical protein D3C86_1353710 [compost metagenome]